MILTKTHENFLTYLFSSHIIHNRKALKHNHPKGGTGPNSSTNPKILNTGQTNLIYISSKNNKIRHKFSNKITIKRSNTMFLAP